MGAPDGTPVIISWEDNVNSAVKYSIYRKHGKFGPTNLIATVNSGVETYTDYDMCHTSNTSTDNLTWYDVRAYYPVDDMYAEADFIVLYSEVLPKQRDSEIDSTYSTADIKEYALNSNYPNPFNPTTQISYQLPENSFVNLIVYNAIGQKVAELVNQNQISGKYSVQFNAENLPSGVYIYKLQIDSFSDVKKMLLLR
jgi:hypothetical protein